ncbi:MAG: rubrerythrin family protein [Rudaea sp.]
MDAQPDKRIDRQQIITTLLVLSYDLLCTLADYDSEHAQGRAAARLPLPGGLLYMRPMTQDGLQAAYAGESQAHMRYLAFADQAEKEGLKNIARLFRAASFSEQIHATSHLKQLGGIKNACDNLDVAIGGEMFEVNEMYPAYAAVAELQQEKGALRSMSFALEAEKVHAALYARAREAAGQNQDVQLAEVWVCQSCGMTFEGEPPESCPVCGAPLSRFKKFE